MINGYTNMSYSQGLEEKIILDYFGDFKGSLLDIGANNGVTFSNSRQLILNGWKAVLVEPSLAYNKLVALYGEDNENVKIENVALSNKEGILTFYEVEDSLLSTLNKKHADMWGRPYHIRKVEVLNAANFKEQHARYDFINIDTEGEDWNILQRIDLTNTKCLCIEFGTHAGVITHYCGKYGMRLLFQNGENMIFVK